MIQSKILAGNEDMHKRLDEFEFGQDLTPTAELAALEHLKTNVTTFSQLLLIQSFLNLHAMRTCIISCTSSNFGPIGPPTTEISAFESLKNTP